MNFRKIIAVLAAMAMILTAMIPAGADTEIPPVADIIDGPTNATTGTPLLLGGTIIPFEAAQGIVWSVTDAGTTGAVITGSTATGYTFTAPDAGTVVVRAVAGSFQKEFTITVNAAFIPVATISGIPANQTVGNFTLAGVVEPANATNKGIVWSVLSAGTTGATITGNTLATNGTGTVTIRAVIANGLTSDTPFQKDFSIDIGTQTISTASATVPVPETFGLRPETATLPTNANYTVSSVAWRVVNTAFSGPSFIGNTSYTVDITIAANPGFVFAEVFTGNINSNTAAIVRNTNDTITMSREFSATRAASVLPTAPRDFKAEPGNNQVRLTWTAPQNNGGSNIVRYQVSYGKTEGYQRAWENIPNSGPNTTGYTITGLENDVEYIFELRAVNNAYGGGVATSAIRSKPVGTATAPQNFRVSPGNGNVLISWTPPSFTGGTIVNYEFSYGASGSYTEEWREIPRSGPGTTSYLVGSTTDNIEFPITNGVEYTFQVRAVNGNGEGVATAKLNGMPAENVISAPRGLTATAGNEQIVISWSAPQSTGGNPITKYQFSCITTAGNPTWRDIPDSGANTTSYTIPDLTNGTTYFIEVRAVSSNVQGGTSGVRIATPVAPVSNTTTSVDNRSTEIQTAANNNSGQNITVSMTSGSNSISKSVLDAIRGKNVNLILDYGTTGRITINGNNVNATNGAATLNMNLQRISGTASMIADYNIPKSAIEGISPLPTHQLKIGTGNSVAINGTVTVNLTNTNSGRNALLCRFDSTKNQFSVVGSAAIASNGDTAISFTDTGDYVIIIQRKGDVTGDNAVGTDDALEVLRGVAGLITLTPVQEFAAKGEREGAVTTNDAMVILRQVAGLSDNVIN
jgi:hypothetical protein